MEFAIPKHKRGEIDRAGELIVRARHEAVWGDVDEAILILDNWRSSHSYPMQVIRNNIARRARDVEPNAIIAQRLKRFTSTVEKLEREPSMKLSQMQDLGGCRAIMSSTAKVYELLEKNKEAWTKNPKRHELHRIKDYIRNPKASGYRSVHLIYKFKSEGGERAVHDNQRIEVQIRSRSQHSWATAVEVVGAFTRESLKSSQGSQEWRRLFSLMGSVLAGRERTAPVPGTPGGAELSDEIRELADHIRADEFLAGCSRAAVHIQEKMPDAKYYIVVLDVATKYLNVTPFKSLQLANAEYAEAERINRNDPAKQTVLVSVDSLDELSKAYPNYYLDVSQFRLELQRVLMDPVPKVKR